MLPLSISKGKRLDDCFTAEDEHSMIKFNIQEMGHSLPMEINGDFSCINLLDVDRW